MTTNRKMKQVLRTGAFLSCSLSFLYAHAFEPVADGHGNATINGVSPVSTTIDGVNLKFSQRAINEIKNANFDTDKLVNQLRPSFHFDDETIQSGTQRIVDLKAKAIQAALANQGKEARMAIGAALHTRKGGSNEH